MEWRLRLTGSRVEHVTTARFAEEGLDYPNDPRQSTLYTWWAEEAGRIGNLQAPLDELDVKIKEWEGKLEALKGEHPGNGLNYANAMGNLAQTSKQIADLKRHVETAAKTIESVRIPASLARFDDFFRLARTTANMRWFLLEISMPLIVGLVAFYLLAQ